MLDIIWCLELSILLLISMRINSKIDVFSRAVMVAFSYTLVHIVVFNWIRKSYVNKVLPKDLRKIINE